MESNRFFEETPPIKLFFLAAIPGGISMLASSLYTLLDGVFVGQFLGETAFAALNLAISFVIINFSLADLIGVGSSVPISICLGKGQDKEANNIFTCSCLMIVVTGALMGGILYAGAPWLIRLFGAEGELAQFAVDYMRVYALSSPVTTIVFAMDNYLRICGRLRESMALNLLMSILSAVLEYLFLGVFHWGVWAAAFATCIGMFVCALVAFYPFLRGRLQLRLCKPNFSAALVREVVRCGSPSFLSNIAGRITAILMNMVLMRFGGAMAVSVYGILMYVGELVQTLLYGISDSLQPAVSYNWGAANRKRVKSLEKCCFTASAVLSLAAAAVVFCFPEAVIALFAKEAEGLFLVAAVIAMRLFSLTFVFRWFAFSTQSFMTAVGKSRYASVLSVGAALVFPVLLMALLWPLELTGIWLNFPATYILAALLSAVLLLCFRREWQAAEAGE